MKGDITRKLLLETRKQEDVAVTSKDLIIEDSDGTILVKLSVPSNVCEELAGVLNQLIPIALKSVGIDTGTPEEREQKMREAGYKPMLAEDGSTNTFGGDTGTDADDPSQFKASDEDEDEELTGGEIFSKFIDDRHLYGTEGETGVRNLNTIAEALGYEESGFKYGTSLEQFLADNSGCVEAIHRWIEEWIDRVPEWKEMLRMED